MSMPNNTMTGDLQSVELLYPDNANRELLVDWELGGIAIGDPSQGMQVQAWRAFYEADVVVCATPTGDATDIITVPGITELSVCFDQNMRPVVAYVVDGETFLYWYDPSIEDVTTTSYGTDVKSPFLTHDDKRLLQVNASDVLFFYIKDVKVYYRQQRDRYLIERHVADLPSDEYDRIMKCGMSVGNRIQVNLNTLR